MKGHFRLVQRGLNPGYEDVGVGHTSVCLWPSALHRDGSCPPRVDNCDVSDPLTQEWHRSRFRGKSVMFGPHISKALEFDSSQFTCPLGDPLTINNQPGMAGQMPVSGPNVAAAVPATQIYQFRGGAASWFGTQILGVLITVCTFGICYPFAVVLVERWRAKNTYLYGRQLQFVGTGWGIFGLWIKWLLLSIITLGIYTFWVYPRLMQWKVERTVYA
jgi:hypothetical protein